MTDHAGDRPLGHQAAGTGRHRAPERFFSTPLVPPDSGWDPAEELAFMLQDAMQEANSPKIPGAREEHPSARDEYSYPREENPVPRDETPVTEPVPGSPLDNLREITAELPPLRRLKGEAPRGHRKVRRRGSLKSIRTVSQVIAALTAVIASAVSFFGGMVSYDPLRIVAIARMEAGVASWWPLLVYGPWLVASLSVLRAALHQRRAVHSWCVVLFFSSIAMLLCVLQAPRTIVDISAAALPGLASLACFQQLVRQITLTRPPRRAIPRHRLPRATPPEPQATDNPATTPKPGSPRPAPSKTSTTTPRTPGTSTRRSPSQGR
ncbi:DUF2637 domain-containing protein [Streptomyces anandii]|uniref:DUF2637 domain-containing protein n=1 Tax=Streptomyces anandii TaxID=285454 RepID=UPI00167255E7|nr:DUF2637 domain-containing protein [Streptomyces anandii]